MPQTVLREVARAVSWLRHLSEQVPGRAVQSGREVSNAVEQAGETSPIGFEIEEREMAETMLAEAAKVMRVNFIVYVVKIELGQVNVEFVCRLVKSCIDVGWVRYIEKALV